MENYLAATYYFDFSHPSIQTFVSDTIKAATSQEERAIQLYFKVRGQWFYDAYQLNTDKSQFKASHVAPRKRGHCIDKAVLVIKAVEAKERLPRIAQEPDHYLCKFCDFQNHCWETEHDR